MAEQCACGGWTNFATCQYCGREVGAAVGAPLEPVALAVEPVESRVLTMALAPVGASTAVLEPPALLAYPTAPPAYPTAPPSYPLPLQPPPWAASSVQIGTPRPRWLMPAAVVAAALTVGLGGYLFLGSPNAKPAASAARPTVAAPATGPGAHLLKLMPAPPAGSTMVADSAGHSGSLRLADLVREDGGGAEASRLFTLLGFRNAFGRYYLVGPVAVGSRVLEFAKPMGATAYTNALQKTRSADVRWKHARSRVLPSALVFSTTRGGERTQAVTYRSGRYVVIVLTIAPSRSGSAQNTAGERFLKAQLLTLHAS